MNDMTTAGGKKVRQNKVKAVFRQNLAWVNKAGEAKTFNEEQEFSAATDCSLTSEQVAFWMLCQLKHFFKLSRLQGRTGFKLSKPIELELSVNGKTETFGFKFSMNQQRIERAIERHPEMIAEAFVASPAIGQINKNKAIEYLTRTGTITIAAAKRALELAEVKTDNIQELDVETV